jgi:hypothetical protein
VGLISWSVINTPFAPPQVWEQRVPRKLTLDLLTIRSLGE